MDCLGAGNVILDYESKRLESSFELQMVVPSNAQASSRPETPQLV
jgi:hypothetical protein